MTCKGKEMSKKETALSQLYYEEYVSTGKFDTKEEKE
jgi:hypothetical protein